jgi:hypothetical protein
MDNVGVEAPEDLEHLQVSFGDLPLMSKRKWRALRILFPAFSSSPQASFVKPSWASHFTSTTASRLLNVVLPRIQRDLDLVATIAAETRRTADARTQRRLSSMFELLRDMQHRIADDQMNEVRVARGLSRDARTGPVSDERFAELLRERAEMSRVIRESGGQRRSGGRSRWRQRYSPGGRDEPSAAAASAESSGRREVSSTPFVGGSRGCGRGRGRGRGGPGSRFRGGGYTSPSRTQGRERSPRF